MFINHLLVCTIYYIQRQKTTRTKITKPDLCGFAVVKQWVNIDIDKKAVNLYLQFFLLNYTLSNMFTLVGKLKYFKPYLHFIYLNHL